MPFTGKKVGVGVSLEATRGEKNLPIQYRFPRTDNTFSDKANVESDSGVVDTIVDSINSEVTKQWSEGTIGGQVYPNGIGFFLKALLGSVTSDGDDGIYEHNFSLLESNTHPTLTVGCSNPISGNSYPLAMIESIDFTAEVGGKFTVSINLKAKKGEDSEHTVTYTDENGFIANMLKVFIADNLEGLDNADNICLQSITISIKKEIKDIECLSSIDPIDYINSSFSIEGSMEMLFEDNTYKDYFLNGTPKALRLLAEDTKHPYEGVDNYPTFMLDLAKIKITDWTPAFTVDDITKQSISFKGHYDVKSKKAIEVYLKNTQPSYDSDYTPDEEDDPNATYDYDEIRNPETQRYEFIINKTSNNRVKTMKLYMNYHPTNTELNWSITREKTENGRTTAEESNTQVNILTRNWIVNSKINDNEFGASNWDFLWNFDLDTSYIHYFIQKLDDYNYILGQKYLNEPELINPYPFTISHDDTLIKHGYSGDEIIAGGQDAEDFISYVHNHEDMIIQGDENLEAELREMNRYSYNMSYTSRDNGGEYSIIGNYSGSQQHHCVRNADGVYTIIDQRERTETQTDQAKWESVLSMFETYRETNDYPEDATRINLDNSQYNSVMSIIGGTQITEKSYEWTDDVQ